MAQILSATIGGINGQSITSTTFGFPVQGILIRPAPAATIFNGVTMLTIIQMLPAGTKIAQDQYFSPTALATVITAANA